MGAGSFVPGHRKGQDRGQGHHRGLRPMGHRFRQGRPRHLGLRKSSRRATWHWIGLKVEVGHTWHPYWREPSRLELREIMMGIGSGTETKMGARVITEGVGLGMRSGLWIREIMKGIGLSTGEKFMYLELYYQNTLCTTQYLGSAEDASRWLGVCRAGREGKGQ